MAFLAAAAPYIGLATAGISAAQQHEAGKSQQAQLRLEAAQDKREANMALAESQANAANERRRAKILRSRALALAGASGTGIDDPSIVDALDSITDEGELRALDALYEGNYLAAGLRSGADARRRMGRAAGRAGTASGLATGLAGVTSFAERYS